MAAEDLHGCGSADSREDSGVGGAEEVGRQLARPRLRGEPIRIGGGPFPAGVLLVGINRD